MQWNDHSRDMPEGAHAFLGASQHAWLNYSPEKLAMVFRNREAAKKGTKLHEIAKNLIDEKIELPRKKLTLNMYVNDGIKYRLRTEQPLKYSRFSFGTADAIGVEPGLLRIHDLKSGVTPTSFKQLEIYASLFFLEYDLRPGDFDIELRIYQNNNKLILNPKTDEIVPIMDKIVTYTELLERIVEEELEDVV